MKLIDIYQGCTINNVEYESLSNEFIRKYIKLNTLLNKLIDDYKEEIIDRYKYYCYNKSIENITIHDIIIENKKYFNSFKNGDIDDPELDFEDLEILKDIFHVLYKISNLFSKI